MPMDPSTCQYTVPASTLFAGRARSERGLPCCGLHGASRWTQPPPHQPQDSAGLCICPPSGWTPAHASAPSFPQSCLSLPRGPPVLALSSGLRLRRPEGCPDGHVCPLPRLAAPDRPLPLAPLPPPMTSRQGTSSPYASTVPYKAAPTPTGAPCLMNYRTARPNFPSASGAAPSRLMPGPAAKPVCAPAMLTPHLTPPIKHTSRRAVPLPSHPPASLALSSSNLPCTASGQLCTSWCLDMCGSAANWHLQLTVRVTNELPRPTAHVAVGAVAPSGLHT